ncbi:response regulator transcription factor [Niastella caeni]|uniref:Response regulator transcription factor n=1 Tax=Niastella caeni TaxID=2569763 RepID=A0A4S8HKT2_9BACT|nr:LytTR family DNA-binding domain-containing protein [Niastella caeni]THU35817.1 response regulator transcription factor [Niastella caeni]
MKKIRVIVIDDERSSREELKGMLKNYLEFEVVAEAKNADEAKEQIEAKQPDLLLLDIEMPEKTGFELLESLEHAPAVLFTTAYNQYAVQAFEINALDYLVKPIREERLAKAIEKVRNNIGIALVDRQIFIKDGEQCYFIRLNEIYLIESLDNYSRLYFRKKKLVLKRSLRQWERLLDTHIFFRISRTQIINTNHIQEIHNIPGNRLKISLKTGQLLEVSGRQSVKFKNLNGI